ncbi:HDOD domain-containing protein [Methylogaea oryzae]|uniref:HD family phosphohydrolase n=1 Tax=Methylogaea oryzae TaxID=1295382 RepID=A0A8D5AI96_9GAMM|nr:HDOD domain-containing protein [Methylogaea oryzae]BBL72298.1 HD family phosphohydrolase [Methylogaea oryzae]
MKQLASELVSDVGGLITLPDIYLKIDRLVNDPKSSTADIAKVVSQDASFTARLLQVANSALYSAPSSVDSVPKAISIIGIAQIRNLALSISVAKSFGGLLNELVSMENFWRHSQFCALAARQLAKEARRCDPDTLFTAGLLHDIGELIIFNRLPEQAKETLLLVLDSQDEMPIHEAEKQVLGLDHTDVGGELAKLWHLPSVLIECIACHHNLAACNSHPRETALVHIANVAALMAELDTLEPDDVPPIDPYAWEVTGLTPASLEPVVRFIQAEIVEIAKLF